MRRVLPILCPLFLAFGACASATSTQPDIVVQRFAIALQEGRYDDAYGMMSSDYKRRVTRDEFITRLSRERAETVEMARMLEKGTKDAEVTSVVRTSDGQEIGLELTSKGWRFSTNIANYYDQSTPRAALRSFLRAMHRKRYDVVLRLVPEADRKGMNVEQMKRDWEGEGREEVEMMLARLRENLDNDIEEAGDHATMPYADRYAVQFVREGSSWKIEDPD